MAKAAAKAPTKGQVLSSIADETQLTRKQVAAVFDSLTTQIKKSLTKVGTFQIPGLCKMVVKKKPATKERMGVNPFTKEPQLFKAKPASKKVTVRPLKALKALVS